jgi:multidrug efflux pump subunit AcrA (membrane-fusion protein)
MERMNPWMAGLLTAIGLQAVVIDPLKASDVKRVSLTARSAERLDIKTAPVSAQQIVRKRTAEGKVLASPAVTVPTPATPAGAMHLTATAAGVGALVRVPLAGDVDKVAQEKPARIVPISAKDAKSAETGWTARATQAPHDADPKEAAKALYYVVEEGGQALAPGQRVQLEYFLAGSGKQRLTVPYSAVIYDPRGDAWVYTSPEPLVYVRHRIKVDYIEGDLAVLADGPSPGTAVVTAGAAQLFGAEYKVGY